MLINCSARGCMPKCWMKMGSTLGGSCEGPECAAWRYAGFVLHVHDKDGRRIPTTPSGRDNFIPADNWYEPDDPKALAAQHSGANAWLEWYGYCGACPHPPGKHESAERQLGEMR